MTAQGPSKDGNIKHETGSTINSISGASVDRQGSPLGIQTTAVPDSELAQKVAEALRRTGHSSLGELQVSTQTGVVTLQGQVPNAYLKVLAMTTALTVSGAWWVVNCLDVSICSSK